MPYFHGSSYLIRQNHLEQFYEGESDKVEQDNGILIHDRWKVWKNYRDHKEVGEENFSKTKDTGKRKHEMLCMGPSEEFRSFILSIKL